MLSSGDVSCNVRIPHLLLAAMDAVIRLQVSTGFCSSGGGGGGGGGGGAAEHEHTARHQVTLLAVHGVLSS